MYTRILLATDGSEVSRRAGAEAVQLARASGAQLFALHVLDLRPPSLSPPEILLSAAFRSLLAELRRAGEDVLREVAETGSRGGLSVTTELVEGIPADAILDVARERRADLLVLGTHGHSGIKALVPGSTAYAVLHDSPIPVLLVR